MRGLGRLEPRSLGSLLDLVCESEVPLGAEEEIELDALISQLRAACRAGAERDVASRARGGLPLSPLRALGFWLMKCRAGQVGERLGREILAPLLGALEDSAPRLHLIDRSFGAKLVASAVLRGLQADSRILLLAALSAFAFAEEVPGTKRPGAYPKLVTDGLVSGPVVALYSDHDRALRTLYPALTWGGQVDRTIREEHHLTYTRERVVPSALGATGALGVGALRFDLLDVLGTGLPRGAVNIDGSRVVRRQEWLIGAHRDIYHDEIGTLVALGRGLMRGGPEGAHPPGRPALRKPRQSPLAADSKRPSLRRAASRPSVAGVGRVCAPLPRSLPGTRTGRRRSAVRSACSPVRRPDRSGLRTPRERAGRTGPESPGRTSSTPAAAPDVCG